MTSLFRRFASALTGGLILAAASAAAAADYPTRPVRLIVPYVAGSPADNAARLVGQELSARWGQAVIVENRAGGNGMIGVDAAARAEPDGYTLILGNMDTHALNSLLFDNIRYDPRKDFAPVIQLGTLTTTLVARPDFPASGLAEVIALSRRHPGKYTWGSWGQGSVAHLWGAQLNDIAGIEWLHVPFKGTPPAIVAVMGGQIDFLFMPPSVAVQSAAEGKVRLLGVTSATRMPKYPDVPTLQEQGLEGYEGTTWFGLFAPAGTPRPVIEKLNREIDDILRQPTAQGMLDTLSMTVVGGPPERLAQAIESSQERWGRVIEAHGITLAE